jgi:phosphohistidine swiveling domain-containing protein
MSTSGHDSRAWVTAVARPNTPLFLSFLISGQERTAIETHTGLPFGFENIRRTGIRLQYDRDELAHATEIVHEQGAESGIAFFERYAAVCLDTCQALLETVDEIAMGQRDRVHDRESIAPPAARYFAAATALGTFLQTLIVVQFELEDVLRRFVADRLDHPSEHDTRQASGALQIALEATDELRNLREMLELAVLVQETVPHYRDWIAADPIAVVTRMAHQHCSIWANVESYQARFGWMGRRYYSGDPITAIDIVLRLQNLLREDCGARLADMDARRSGHLDEREQTIAMLGGDDTARRLADVLSLFMHLRSYRLDVFFMAHERVVPVFEDLARLLALDSYDDTPYLSWQELMDGIQERCDERELTSRAAARRAGFELVSRAGLTEWIPDSSPATSASAPAAPSDVIHGVPGWGGRLQGRVRVVMSDDDMLHMEPGEVLVTTMTQPRLMLAVEKAGAIVTDEGGMLCHAVLVSREFNLPCVIGTERATHILRTGDLVNVDATTGVVQRVT